MPEEVKRWIKVKQPHSYKQSWAPLKVRAWVVPGIPDLFVNQAGRNYVVTHRGTGLRLNIPYLFKTRKSAILFMKEANELIDWSVKDKETLMERNPVMSSLLTEIAEERFPKALVPEYQQMERKPLGKKRRKLKG